MREIQAFVAGLPDRVAMAEREPLLFEGEDLSRTDVEVAPY